MKNIIMWFVLLFSCVLHSQTQEKPSIFPSKDNSELLDLTKFLFIPETTFSFNVSEKLVKRSFADINNGKKYDQDYLNELLSTLKSDSLNPIYLKNVAEFYQNTAQIDRANRYYSKAYKHLDTYFELHGKKTLQDSASYYALRGMLKTNLRDSSAIKDFEKSMFMNPVDSTLISIYPVLLIGTGKFEEAKSCVINSCKANLTCTTTPYILLIGMEIPFTLAERMKEDKKDSISMAYRNKNFDDIFDYDILDNYASLCKENQEIQNARLMADILGLLIKAITNNELSNFKYDTFNNFKSNNLQNFETKAMQYNHYEMKRIYQIIEILADLKLEKKLNEYQLNKCFGIVYFMLKDWEKSIEYFNKAIEVFPAEKRDSDFSPDESYDVLRSIYFLKSDTLNFRRVIHKKMADEPIERKSLDDQMLLAFDYFLEGDLRKAEDYCKKVRALNPDHFDALRLMAHISFLRSNKPLTQLLIDRANRHIRNNEDSYNLLLQVAIYQINNGALKSAQTIIQKVKEKKGPNNCDLCDILLTEYCKD